MPIWWMPTERDLQNTSDQEDIYVAIYTIHSVTVLLAI